MPKPRTTPKLPAKKPDAQPKLLDAYFDQGESVKGMLRISGAFPNARVALVVETGMTWVEVRDALVTIRKQFKE